MCLEELILMLMSDVNNTRYTNPLNNMVGRSLKAVCGVTEQC